MMLGARRTTVTLIAGVLQRRGLIKYQRGKVKILDRAELEAASCDCYQITKELYASLYSQPLSTAEVEGSVPAAAGVSDKSAGKHANGAGSVAAPKKEVVGRGKAAAKKAPKR